MSDWFTSHSLIIQAFVALVTVLLTAVLVGTTVYYARTTNRILEESRKSREAAERQATASQENLELLKRQYEAQLGQGPHILYEALVSAKALLPYWTKMADVGQGNPHSVPDPAPLGVQNLVRAEGHARSISSECVIKVLQVINNLQLAKSDFERIRQSYRGPGLSPAAIAGADPKVYLEHANEAMDAALAIIAQHTKSHTPDAA